MTRRETPRFFKLRVPVKRVASLTHEQCLLFNHGAVMFIRWARAQNYRVSVYRDQESGTPSCLDGWEDERQEIILPETCDVIVEGHMQ